MELPSWLAGIVATLPLWPLLAAGAIGVLIAANRWREAADKLAVGGTALTALIGLLLFFGLSFGAGGSSHDESDGHALGPIAPMAATGSAGAGHGGDQGAVGHTIHLFNWISLGTLHSGADQWIAMNFFVDHLTSIMLLFFTFVATMVVIYATGYMRDHHGHPEPGYERFFAYIALFVFSMAMLVLSGNFVLLYLGWELVGLCSYLLIGFYFKKPEAAAAAKKAFLVNRIGDFGFALGIFAIYWVLASPLDPSASVLKAGENPLDYAVVFKYAEHIAQATIGGVNAASVISLLLLCGALGKSAQFPLYVWLPDAMEGPTPVSALIHAATMVTAGVYLVARCGPLFMGADPWVLDIVLALGLIGAVLAATMAMAQYDMKRILAYSTISQLAFMFVALGCAAPKSAVFHVFTHAFFKALLFLTAGSVMHAMGNVIDLRKFSGLKRTLPTTYKQMLIGCLALAGVPLLAGFWSKDEIVHAAWLRHPAVGVIMMITAGMTAYYTFRMFFLCFNGERRLPPEAGDHPHEMPRIMTAPLWVLAFFAIFVGYLGVTFKVSASDSFLLFLNPHGYFHDFLAESSVVEGSHGADHHAATHGGADAAASAGAAEGSTGGKGKKSGDIWIAYVSGLIALAGIGVAYLRYGGAPKEDPDRAALGPVFNLWHHKYWVDELYGAMFVRPLRGLGQFFFGTDRNALDGAVWLVGALPRGLAFGLSWLQRGALQSYALGMVAGLALLLIVWQWVLAG